MTTGVNPTFVMVSVAYLGMPSAPASKPRGVRKIALRCKCDHALGEVYLHPGGGIVWAPSRRGSGQPGKPKSRPRSTDLGVPGAVDALEREMAEMMKAYMQDGNDERALRIMYNITLECRNPACRPKTLPKVAVSASVCRALDAGRIELVVGVDL